MIALIFGVNDWYKTIYWRRPLEGFVAMKREVLLVVW